MIFAISKNLRKYSNNQMNNLDTRVLYCVLKKNAFYLISILHFSYNNRTIEMKLISFKSELIGYVRHGDIVNL